MNKRLTTQEIVKMFGAKCDQANFVMVSLPFPMKLAWDLDVTITKVKFHKLVAHQFKRAFEQILGHYGIDKIRELKIDVFGGAFNCRPMRGGQSPSRHSWAIAFDLDPERNGLKTPFSKAQFSKPEYKPMMDIFERNGFLNYGVMRDNDAMHFEVFEIQGESVIQFPSPQPTIEFNYTVVAGDTLTTIAKKTNTTIAHLKHMNHLTADLIRVGQKLII